VISLHLQLDSLIAIKALAQFAPVALVAKSELFGLGETAVGWNFTRLPRTGRCT